MKQASSIRAENMRAPRWKREAERFRSFLDEYRRKDGNAYQAALAAGYSKSTAKAKSYRLAQLAEAYEHLERLGLTASASNPSATSLNTAQNSGEAAAVVGPDISPAVPQNQPALITADQRPFDNSASRQEPVRVWGFARLPNRRRWYVPKKASFPTAD